MAQLLFKGVNKVYPNGNHAVHDFDMEIKDGEFICLAGDSGCGKSTILRMIAGLEDITSGEFCIDGALANQTSPRDRGIAMVFQGYALYPHLTVYENLGFGLTLEGIDRDVIDEKVKQTAKILELTECLDRFPRTLSGGQCQRVAVGRALIRNLNIFLMDEPLSNRDAKQRVAMLSEIKQIHRSVGATTIYATRDRAEAMAMSDRIVVMKSGGYVQQTGTPCELYFHPKNLFVAGFIGDPPMNFIRGTVEEGCLKKGGLKLDLTPVVKDVKPLEGREAVFAFRPEAIKPVDGKSAPEGYLLGSEVYSTELSDDMAKVYADVGNDSVILKVNPDCTPVKGDVFKFTVPYGAAYVFDAETELAVESDVKRH